MSFEDEDEAGKDKGKKFFGLELSDGLTYVVIIILALIFVRQVSVLF